jgi:hypothetical protein
MAGGPQEVAEYVSALCVEMQQMASRVGLDLLAELLKAAAAEAQRHRKPPLRIIESGAGQRGGSE